MFFRAPGQIDTEAIFCNEKVRNLAWHTDVFPNDILFFVIEGWTRMQLFADKIEYDVLCDVTVSSRAFAKWFANVLIGNHVL